MSDLKICGDCKKEFPLDHFGLRRIGPNAGNRTSQCRACRREAKRKWGKANPDKRRAHVVKWNNKQKESPWDRRKRQIETDPVEHQKYISRHKFRGAVRYGKIESLGEQFHHPDYSRPYYGCWVTVEQHAEIHRGFIPCPPCVDYAEQVKNRKSRRWPARAELDKLKGSQ